MNQDSLGTWKKSYKRSIVNGNVVYSEWTDSASKDCSATVTPVVPLEVDGCTEHESKWYKISAMIDGASVPGYSTLSAPTSAPTSVESTDAPTSGNTAPTGAPTAPTTVSQAVTVSSLKSADYSGALKKNYEKGFGVAVDACTSPCSSYNSGIAISSSASRRAATLTFVMTLSGVADTNAYTGGCSGTFHCFKCCGWRSSTASKSC